MGPYVICIYCIEGSKQFKKQYLAGRAVINCFNQHLTGRNHEINKAKPRMTSYYRMTGGECMQLSTFDDEFLARRCMGLWQLDKDMRYVLDNGPSYLPGPDGYATNHTRHTLHYKSRSDKIVFEGSFVSNNCAQYCPDIHTTFADFICNFCRSLVNNTALKRKVAMAAQKSTLQRRYVHEFREQLIRSPTRHAISRSSSNRICRCTTIE